MSLVVELGIPSPAFLKLVPKAFAREHLLLSGGARPEPGQEPVERLLVTAQTSSSAILNVRTRLQRRLEVVEVDGEHLLAHLEAVYRTSDQGMEPGGVLHGPSSEEVDGLLASTETDLLATAGKGPVVRLLDEILFAALQQGASDVHLEPGPEALLVRTRVDGVLGTVQQFDPRLLLPLATRVKVLGAMDVAERRLPQDGRTALSLGNRKVDMRISTFPSRYGERVVLRLLDTGRQMLAIDQIGMPEAVRGPFLELAQRPHGLILVTGSTGSGKTTTLYATLQEVATPDKNVMTIEDPIEYDLAAQGLTVSQSQVSPKRGVTFATGLRHVLRQDPDVILVGEIRDTETARLAIQASLTGHLVFATLHTGDADAAVRRLVDLGVEEYLVRDSLLGVLAQRLERVPHAACEGQGCPACAGRGFERRRAVFDLWAQGMRA